jgi:transposase
VGKNGSKRHVLVDGDGVPLSLVLTGANRHDVTQLAVVLDAIVVPRPEFDYRKGAVENLCADKGYFGEPALETIVLRGYIPHVVSRGEEKKQLEKNPAKKARRWVVERVFAWLNRFRKIFVRYEKYDFTYLGLLQLACAFIAFRQVDVI